MTRFFFFDLDSTLIYSKRAISQHNPGTDFSALVPVDHRDGNPASYMTERSWETLARLMSDPDIKIVPVTTRSAKQYGRVILPAVPEYALAGNGSVLFRDNIRCPKWDTRIASKSDTVPDPIAKIITQAQNRDWFTRSAFVEDRYFCVTTDHPDSHDRAWAEELEAAAGTEWHVSYQGKKINIVPTWLTKDNAALELLSIHGDTGNVWAAGAGDSLLDLGLVTRLDAGIHPRHGELAGMNLAGVGVEQTSTVGLYAGEEILDWASAQAA